MKIYRINEQPDKFKTLALDVVTLAEQLGDFEYNRLLRAQGRTNQSLKEIWTDKITSQMEDVIGKNSAVPDISIWNRTNFLLNDKAYNALKPHLHDKGEFLPITVDGISMHIFNCMVFGKENEELCVKKFSDGIDFGWEKIVFDIEDINGKLIFKSLLEGCLTLFSTEAFKMLCEENDLKGLAFTEDLLNPYL